MDNAFSSNKETKSQSYSQFTFKSIAWLMLMPAVKARAEILAQIQFLLWAHNDTNLK